MNERTNAGDASAGRVCHDERFTPPVVGDSRRRRRTARWRPPRRPGRCRA
ncbi:MAG: hypothetical protein MZV64_30790 [Ignavibacteriales bacterium]|nr:hypothetical protein [Ignavibacteriales bacterium]